jgi:hypothetical protein
MVDRRTFLQGAAALGVTLSAGASPVARSSRKLDHPLAIAMWDFSWLERRWPGAGYEDWDMALSGLKERGYDAVRIDAFPHFVAADPEKEWELIPVWTVEMWGSPAINRVTVQPTLSEFLAKCDQHGLRVAFSTWWREDSTNIRANIKTPQDMANVWLKTLDNISKSYSLDKILYVDFNNEFPDWMPWIKPNFDPNFKRTSPRGTGWMRDTISLVKQKYPHLNCTFSFSTEYDTWREQDVSMLDLLEIHLWMTSMSDFYKLAGYHFQEFDPSGYDNLQKNAERLYRSDPARWQGDLTKGIDLLADWARTSRKPLLTTECWGLVTFKDWPLFHWDWEKELCEIGVRHAAATGCWSAMATSNFCGPQFVGMWRDVDWHRRLTDVIHQAKLPIFALED